MLGPKDGLWMSPLSFVVELLFLRLTSEKLLQVQANLRFTLTAGAEAATRDEPVSLLDSSSD